jgi:hypothetical protein
LSNQLPAAVERARLDISFEILRHTLPNKEKADNNRNRQKHVEDASSQIDPETAERACRTSCKATNQSNREDNARRSR